MACGTSRRHCLPAACGCWRLTDVVDAAGCYVRLHGYGYADDVSRDDWFIAMAANDVVYMNASRQRPVVNQGVFTYVLHPSDCTATDLQNFNMYTDSDASPRLISYLHGLADGRSLTRFSTFMIFNSLLKRFQRFCCGLRCEDGVGGG